MRRHSILLCLLLGVLGVVLCPGGEAAEFFNVTYICESQCPDCRRYTFNQMNEAIQAFHPEYMELESLPYGNAHRTPKLLDRSSASAGAWNFHCQHGASECFGNKLQACATHFYPDLEQWWPFYRCLFERMRPAEYAAACATESGLQNIQLIQKCAEGELGDRLMLHIAKQTERWRSKRTPWVIVNGETLSAAELRGSLVGYICARYTGSDPPAACRGGD